MDSLFFLIFQGLNCVYLYLTPSFWTKQYDVILYNCTIPRAGRPRAHSKDFLFPCQPFTAAQGQGIAASPGLYIGTNLALEVLTAWVPQGLLSYSAGDHACAVCHSIYRPGGHCCPKGGHIPHSA